MVKLLKLFWILLALYWLARSIFRFFFMSGFDNDDP